MLKSKYFPYTDALKAKKDPQLNFTWASIYDAKENMEEGTMWKVGNGFSINVWMKNGY